MAPASRKKRLSISRPVATATVKWNPNAEQWTNIEAAYVLLSEEMRAEIAVIVDRYFQEEPYGRNAGFDADAVAWLREMEKGALGFVWASGQAGGGGARHVAEWALDEHLKRARIPHHRFLMRAMTEYASAATAAAEEINGKEDQPRLHEKDAWRTMAASLWAFAFDHDLPRAIAKNVFPKVSPFVAFVRELQATFGSAPTWHVDSVVTLGEELSRATKDIRKFKTAKT